MQHTVYNIHSLGLHHPGHQPLPQLLGLGPCSVPELYACAARRALVAYDARSVRARRAMGYSKR